MISSIKVTEYSRKLFWGLYFALGRMARSLWRATVAWVLILNMVVPAFALVPAPNALPTGGQVAAGQASVSQTANRMNVQQSTGKLIINWSTFNIGSNASVNFNQPSSSSVALNRVASSNPSYIYGQLTANGKIFLINPGGLLFGPGSSVNVGSFVASTMNMTDSDFLTGSYRFTRNGSTGTIINQGTIKAADGGYIALLAPEVRNEGVITAKMGTIALAAGDAVTLDMAGDNLLNVRVDPATVNTLIENKHLIQADGGTVIMSTSAAGQLLATAISNDGAIVASSLVDKGGVIRLVGANNITNTGTIDASGITGGGQVQVSANNIIDAGGTIDVSATQSGNGGSASLSGAYISTYGLITAKGTGGNGGDILLAGNRIVQTNSATLDASGSTQGGRISLLGGTGEDDGVFSSAGINASGSTGGAITLAGNGITLRGANLDASGSYGGGTIRIGGGPHGAAWSDPISGQGLTNAATTDISTDNVLNASATQAGNGGNIVVWSDQQTYFFGNASARGAGNGDGGYIETSGKEMLQFGGMTDAGSPGGKAGTVLLDPKNITIDATNGSNYTPITNPNPGSGSQFGQSLTTLQNGNTNIVAADPGATVGGVGSAGAVYLFQTNGTLLASLNGSAASDQVGNSGITALTNGNYVVGSKSWSNAEGAATWGSGTTGVNGAVSTSNSLVGSSANDQVGITVTALSNGNYVVGSYNWNGTRGAATWGSGTSGVTSAVSNSNSLVGSSSGDLVGKNITALQINGNYLVASPSWNGSTGAATWGSGTSGVKGTIAGSNSLIGSNAGDRVGTIVTALTNGNYVVGSPSWSNSKGAATWGNGNSGVTGTIAGSNSLIGSLDTSTSSTGSGDQVGTIITALTNGNYIVGSQFWNNNMGAATWQNGTSGGSSARNGTISSSNSLVGSTGAPTGGDEVGSVISALSNGNYVVGSPLWSNGTDSVGAATWGNGTTGVTGTIAWDGSTSSNSLVGSNAGDNVGNSIIALQSNGNYVVASPSWNGARGAATWQDGTVGGSSARNGTISASNSLIGGSTNDNVGSGGITALTNGNYVVASPSWFSSRGAAAWGSGSSGVSGTLSHSNLSATRAISLTGISANDNVGTIITALTNGNYVVGSPSWSSSKGATTWQDGTSGGSSARNGTISASNSLEGITNGDKVGTSVTALSNGNYVVGSPSWNSARGAATWGNGTSGVTGTISAGNSLEGVSAGDKVGLSVTPANGDAFAVQANNGKGGIFNYVTAYGYSDDPSLSITITPSVLTNVLSTGTNFTMQANNDITVNSAVTASGTGGNLTLSAGRSVAINANITTANGNLAVTGNDTNADGVQAANRDAGTGSIAMASGTTINAGTGSVSMTISGSGTTAGDITLGNITAGSVTTQTPGNININSGSQITASNSGNAIALEAGRNFFNNAGSSALSATSGRWLIYSTNPASNTFGALASGNNAVWNSTYSNYAPGSVSETGNRYIFSFQPTATFTPSSASKTYGDTVDLSSSYTVSGVQTSTYGGAIVADTNATAFSGVPGVSSTGSPVTASHGTYNITLGNGSISALDRYQFSVNNSTPGTLTINTRPVTITAANASFIYGDNNPTVTGFTAPTGSAGSGSGLVNGNSVASVTNTVNASTNTFAGTYTSGITPSSAVFGSGLASNYSITYANGTLTINTRPVTITAANASFIYGDNNPTVTGFTAPTGSAGSGSGLVNGNSVASVTNTVNASTNTFAGTYTSGITPSSAVFGSSGNGLASNYNITYANGTLTINTRPLTVTASNTSRVYGDSNPSVTSFTAPTGPAGSHSGLVNNDSVSSVTGTYNAAVITNAGNTSTISPSAAVFGSGLASNYNISYANGTLTINTRPLTVTAGNASRTYGDPNPSVSSFTAPTGSAGSGSGLVNNDSVSSVTNTVNATLTTPTGTATITPSAAIFGSGLSSNYFITYANGTLTIIALSGTTTNTATPGTTANTATPGTTANTTTPATTTNTTTPATTTNTTTPATTTNTTTPGKIINVLTTQADVAKTIVANVNVTSSTIPPTVSSIISISSGPTTGTGSTGGSSCSSAATGTATNASSTLSCVLK